LTHPIPLAAVFEDLASLRRAAFGLGGSRRGAFLGRMERLDTERRDAESMKHRDLELLKARAALEGAWAVEIEKMIALRKAGTVEAKAAVEAARNATTRIVLHIEAQRAETPDGLKLKARAGQWRRNGEPHPRRLEARA
jgi:hypothetical protein